MMTEQRRYLAPSFHTIAPPTRSTFCHVLISISGFSNEQFRERRSDSIFVNFFTVIFTVIFAHPNVNNIGI